MSGYKYACPYCGQHIEYTDGYAGQQMPCPMCQNPIVFPAVPAGLRRSTLRLERDRPKPVQKFEFSFPNLVLFLRDFKHWKVVGICLLPFAVLAGALMAASWFRNNDPPAAPVPIPPAAVAADPQPPSAPTDLAQADQQVQARLNDVKQASAAWQAAQKKKAAVRQQYKGAAAGQPYERAADAAVKSAQKSLADAKAAFATAFTTYQNLGGPIDYRRQLP
jgi:hypothetical protein